MTDYDLQRAKEIERSGRERYGGVDWERLLSRLEIDPEAVRRLITQPDAVDRLAWEGRQRLLELASANDEAASDALRQLRIGERDRRKNR
jgi:hypothetical protein